MRTQTEARSRSLVGHAWVQFRTSETRVSPIHVFVSLTSCRTTLDLEVTLHPTNSAAKLLNDAVMRNGAADEGVRAGHLVGILGRGRRQANEDQPLMRRLEPQCPINAL